MYDRHASLELLSVFMFLIGLFLCAHSKEVILALDPKDMRIFPKAFHLSFMDLLRSDTKEFHIIGFLKPSFEFFGLSWLKRLPGKTNSLNTKIVALILTLSLIASSSFSIDQLKINKL